MRASDEALPPPALPGPRFRLEDPAAGGLEVYGPADGAPPEGPPVLLVHSVNAAASAYEVGPLFEDLARSRPTYAFDLPGFGLSARTPRRYDPRLMTDALLAVAGAVAARHGGGPCDALALSLSCEFLARAATEAPERFRSLAFVSPTGLDKRPRRGPPGSTRGVPWLRAALNVSLWDDALFRGLTKPPVIRYFLERTWGRKEIDEGLWEYDVASARAPGAKHAPLSFLAGDLFSGDATRLYESLTHPVWVSHGVRGDFTDYRGVEALAGRPSWRVTTFETGALPHFEVREAFVEIYRGFLAGR